MFVTLKKVNIYGENNSIPLVILPDYYSLLVKKIKDCSTSKEGIEIMNGINNTKYLLGYRKDIFELLKYSMKEKEEFSWAKLSTARLKEMCRIKEFELIKRVDLICFLKLYNKN